jgi:hypothetical protein
MAEQDAKQILLATLDRYGLGSLVDRVWQLYTDDTIQVDSGIDTIGDALREAPEFKQRFSANEARLRAGLPELSVSEYITLERGYENAMRGSGLPRGFYDESSDFSNFISTNTSVAEVQDRVNEGYKAVTQSNPEVINQMRQLYGVTEGDLAAYFLDPQRALPLITQRARAAQIAAEGQRQAGMQISAQQAEAIAREGVTQQQAQTGFEGVRGMQELLNPLQGEEAITQEEAVGATFGMNAAARQRIETRQRQRRAAFGGGGSFATDQTGMAGIGTVQ